MPEQGPAVISPKLYVKIPNVTGLYRHTKSGRYYGVKNIKGKRKERSLGTTDRAAYAYDFENRLVGLAKTISGTGIITGTYAYMYDYRTRRVLRDETGAGGVKTQLVFSAGTNVQEYTLSGTSGTLAVEYIRGSDYGGGVGGILYTLRGSGQRYTHENRRGDVVAKTDGTGSLRYQAAYEAFGKRPQEAGSTQDRQKANTKDEDPTGLLDEGFRYRDLDTGSFITKDPAGFVDGPNLYTYVVDNPWTHFDPEGLKSIDEYKTENEKLKVMLKTEKREDYVKIENQMIDSNNKAIGKIEATAKKWNDAAKMDVMKALGKSWDTLDDNSFSFKGTATRPGLYNEDPAAFLKSAQGTANNFAQSLADPKNFSALIAAAKSNNISPQAIASIVTMESRNMISSNGEIGFTEGK